MRIVGCITTIPSRIRGIEETLQSILNQTMKLDTVYLCIPYNCRRETGQYLIPDIARDNCEIVRGEDHGPITKLIATLIAEQDPETLIVTFDDDTVYPPELVDKLVAKHSIHPNAALGSEGIKIGRFPFYGSLVFNDYAANGSWYNFNVPGGGEPVDILLNRGAVLYLRGFFNNPEKLISDTIDDCDVLVSGILSERKIERRVYRMPALRATGNCKGGLRSDWKLYMLTLMRSIWQGYRAGMFAKTVPVERMKTISYPVIVGVIVIFILGLLLSTRSTF